MPCRKGLCVVYSQRVHFINEIGAFEEIDNTLIREHFQTDTTTYAWRNARNDVTTRFAENAEPGSYPVRIEKGTTTLEFGFDSEAAAQGKTNPEEVPDLLGGVVDPEASISYADVFPGTDLLYYVGSSGVKEFIIIKNAEAEGIYRFNIHAEETTIEERDNRIVFIDAQGEEVLEITPFFATDSMDHYCGDITHLVEDLGNDNYRLEIVIDQEWLRAEERVYPVVLDPSVMVTGTYSTYDTFVSSAYPTTNYYEDYYLRTGKDSTYGVRKTLIKFDMPSGITSTQVTSAQIRVRKYDGDGTGLRAYRVTGYWTSSGATWNNRPTSSSIYSNVHLDSDNWYYTTVTNCTQGWLSGSYTNYGIYIVDSNESNNSKNARWYSSDSAYPNRPELVVNYSATYTYDVALFAHDSGTDYVNTSTYFDDVSPYFNNTGSAYVTTSYYESITDSSLISSFSNRKYIYILTHGTQTTLMTGPNMTLTKSELSGATFNGTKFIFLLSCDCAYGGYTPSHVTSSGTPINMLEQLVKCGTQTVIGFNIEMPTSDLKLIAKYFTEFMLVDGYTVFQAMDAISPLDIPGFQDYDYENHYVIGGSKFITW